MKRLFRVLTAVLLVLSLAFSCTLLPVYAASGTQQEEVYDETKMKIGKAVIKTFGAVADGLIIGLARLFPNLDWPDADTYKSEYFYSGSKTVTQGARPQWRAGYASESIVPDDLGTVGYVRAGEFHFTEVKTYEVIEGDDQCFRVVALSDSTGSGTVLFCSLDAFGISSANVRRIRAAIENEAAKSGITDIVSINITVSHSHSCLDTHGLGASISGLIGESIKAGFLNAVGNDYAVNSVDEKLMSNLVEKAAKAAVTAVKAMQPGSLYFNSVDINDLLYDKQYPLVYDTNVNQIKFVPDLDSGREIWLVNMGCHPVRMTGSGYVSSDYPGAIVRWADKLANADVAFYQGAQLAITRDEGPVRAKIDDSELAGLDDAHATFYVVDRFGKEIIDRIMNSTPVESFALEPELFVEHAEVSIDVDNSLILLISKISMVNNIVVKTSKLDFTKSKVVSEVGLCRFGSKLAIALIPGEIDPAIVFGGVDTAETSWNGTDWGYKPYSEMVGGAKLIAFGLTNDQIGYIVPDNDYAHAFASLFESLIGGSRNKHYEEMISLGKNTASTLSEAFEGLVTE